MYFTWYICCTKTLKTFISRIERSDAVWSPSFCENYAREFRVGANVDALDRLEEQWAISPEGCRAERPWNRNCVEDAFKMTHDAMADEDTIALKPVECMTTWSFEAPTKIKPKFTEGPRDSQEEARHERWTSVGCAGPVWRQAGKKGALHHGRCLARVLRCVASCAFSLAGDMMKVERDPACVCLRADADVTDAHAALAPRMMAVKMALASFVRVTRASSQTEYVAPPPVTEYVAPAPSSSCATTAPVTESVAPTPDVTHTAPAPVIEHVPQNFPVTVETASFTPVPDASSIPDVTYTAPVPVIKHVSLAPDDTYAAPARLAPAPVTEHIAPARVAPSFCGWVNPQFSTGLVNPKFSQPVWRFLRQRLLGHSSLRLPVRPIRNILLLERRHRTLWGSILCRNR